LPHIKGRTVLKEDLLRVLHKIVNDIEGVQRKIKLYCIGGTELMLAGVRESSKDIDLIMSDKDFTAISSAIAEIEWKEKVRIDPFPNGRMPGYKLPIYSKNAKKAPYLFKNIELYLIDKINFLITKSLGGRDADLEGISQFVSVEDAPESEVRKRFNGLKLDKDQENKIKSKFESFIQEFYKGM